MLFNVTIKFPNKQRTFCLPWNTFSADKNIDIFCKLRNTNTHTHAHRQHQQHQPQKVFEIKMQLVSIMHVYLKNDGKKTIGDKYTFPYYVHYRFASRYGIFECDVLNVIF